MIAFVVAVSIAASAAARQDSVMIDPGMTRAQVVAKLGQPMASRTYAGHTYLLYKNGCERTCGMSDLVVLDDPKHAIPPYDAVVLVSPKRANDAKLADALRPIIGAIDVTLMREANLRARLDEYTPAGMDVDIVFES